jgi:hypothetical protein
MVKVRDIYPIGQTVAGCDPPADTPRSSQNVVHATKKRASRAEARRVWSGIGLIFGSGLYLYFNLFTINGIPYLLDGDQVFFWVYAERLLNGEHIYRDFFQFTPPGTDLVFFSLFRLFGPRLWITNWVVLVLGVVLCWLCFRISLLLMSECGALLASSMFLVLLFGKMLSATHHWFSVLAVTMAVAVLMKIRSPARIMAAGALLGLASFFTQTRGFLVAIGIAVALVFECFNNNEPLGNAIRDILALVFSSLASWASLSSYLLATMGLRRLLTFQITSAQRYVIHGWTFMSLGIPAEDMTWKTLHVVSQYMFVYLLLPSVYAICAWECWKSRETLFLSRERVVLLTSTGLAMMLEVAQSLNWIRVYSVAMPAIILFVMLLHKPARLRAGAGLFTWLCILVLALHQINSRYHTQHSVAQLPGGTVATSAAKAEKMEWLARHTRPNQFFFQAGSPGLYLPLQLRNPVFIDEFDRRGVTPSNYVDSSMRQLDAKGVQYILWSPRIDSPGPKKDIEDNHLSVFRKYLEKNYRQIHDFSDADQLWERKPGTPTTPTPGGLKGPQSDTYIYPRTRVLIWSSGRIPTFQTGISFVCWWQKELANFTH